jgi:hypothetical protein
VTEIEKKSKEKEKKEQEKKKKLARCTSLLHLRD